MPALDAGIDPGVKPEGDDDGETALPLDRFPFEGLELSRTVGDPGDQGFDFR